MENLPINLVDIIILVLAVLSGFLAAARGFVREVLSIGAWVGALAAAIFGYEPVLPYANQVTDIPWLAAVITGAGLFLVTLVALSLISHSVSKSVKESAVGALDRSLGFLFGLVRVAFLICVVYYGLIALIYKEDPLPEMITEARSYPYIDQATRNILSLLPESFRSVLEKSGDDIRGQIDAASEAKRQLDQLNKLRPSGDQDNKKQPAYDQDERSDLEDLIQDNQ